MQIQTRYHEVKQGKIAAAGYCLATFAWFVVTWSIFASSFACFYADHKITTTSDYLYAAGCIAATITLWTLFKMIAGILSCKWPTSSVRRRWELPFLKRTICIYYHPKTSMPAISARANSPSPFVAGLVAAGSCVVAFLWFACSGNAGTTTLGISLLIFGMPALAAAWVGFICIDEKYFGGA